MGGNANRTRKICEGTEKKGSGGRGEKKKNLPHGNRNEKKKRKKEGCSLRGIGRECHTRSAALKRGKGLNVKT